MGRDVTMARLKAEYGVDAIYEPIELAAARWVECEDKKRFKLFEKEMQLSLAKDAQGNLAYLARSIWRLENAMENWPEISFQKTREH